MDGFFQSMLPISKETMSEARSPIFSPRSSIAFFRKVREESSLLICSYSCVNSSSVKTTTIVSLGAYVDESAAKSIELSTSPCSTFL